MTFKNQKVILSALNLAVVIASFEGLIAILGQNQPGIYVKTSFYVGLFYILQIILLYDLHFKQEGSLERAKAKHQNVVKQFNRNLKIFGSAFWDRCYHLRQWQFVRQWLNYLILPGLIFWASIIIFFINFSFPRNQQIFVILSSLALFLNYWYLKEIFSRGREVVDQDIFVVLSVVKIYASTIVYGSILAFIKYYCLPASYATTVTFCLTFFLIYQALFQHKLIKPKTIAITLLISGAMAIINYAILAFWGYNYFTAAVFAGTCYNLMWGVFHYYLDKSLSWTALGEIILISLIVASMVISVTNFKARILDDCRYTFSLFYKY